MPNDFERFSYEELGRGFMAVIATCFIIHWWGLMLAFVCGVLWMAGGTYATWIRRWIIPILTYAVITVIFNFTWYWLIAPVLGVAVLSMGDGFPDHREETKDEGSWLGRWVEKNIDERDYIGGPITKWLVPVIFQVSLIPYFIK